jgi:hypothetical protein
VWPLSDTDMRPVSVSARSERAADACMGCTTTRLHLPAWRKPHMRGADVPAQADRTRAMSDRDDAPLALPAAVVVIACWCVVAGALIAAGMMEVAYAR